MPARTYTEDEIAAAIEGLAGSERFREAERLVASSAPALQKVLAEVLAAGGWFEESHQGALLKAAAIADPDERTTTLRTLLAEEGRVSMLIGVVVGWSLAGELNDQAGGGGPTPAPKSDEEE